MHCLCSVISYYLNFFCRSVVIAFPEIFSFGLKVQQADIKLKKSTVEASSRKWKPSGQEKSVRNWSWSLTRIMVLTSGHKRCKL